MNGKLVQLKDVVKWVRGLTYSKKDEVENNGTPVLRATNIDLISHKIILDDIRQISKSVKIKDEKYIKKGDILICTASGSKSHLGKVALIEQDLKMAFGGFMSVLKCTQGCYSKFLYYILISNKFKKHLSSLNDGANINNLKFSQIEKYEFFLPSISEQQLIVAKLDAAFAEIDKTQKIYDKKKLEIDLIKNKFLLNKLSNVKSSKLFLLNEICNKITDGSHNPPKVSEGSTFMMLSSRNIFDDTINYDRPRLISEQSFHSENKRTDVKKNDVLLTIVGTIGRCAVVKSDDIKFTLQRSVAVFKPKNDLVDSRFLMYLLQSLIKNFNERAAGAAQQGIYLKQLKKTEVKIPTLDKQKELVNDIDNFNNELEKLNKIIIKQKINYDFLKLSILSQKINKIAA